jgi:hypothetical protein
MGPSPDLKADCCSTDGDYLAARLAEPREPVVNQRPQASIE